MHKGVTHLDGALNPLVGTATVLGKQGQGMFASMAIPEKTLGQRTSTETAVYERNFGFKFLSVDTPTFQGSFDWYDRLIVPDSFYGLPTGLAEARVAIVGNGIVTRCGALVDRHDVVIRITSMRNWQKSAAHDGLKLSIWAGVPSFVIAYDEAGLLNVDAHFHAAVEAGIPLWASTPYDTTPTAYRWLDQHGALGALVVTPWLSTIRTLASARMTPADINALFSVAPERASLVGFPIFDTLLTGTKLAVLAELAGASHISLFGCDLFRSAQRELWEGHDPDMDLKVLAAIRRRMTQRGRSFYWHESPESPFPIKHYRRFRLGTVLSSKQKP